MAGQTTLDTIVRVELAIEETDPVDAEAHQQML